ncbi:MAG TPA: thioredoxin [Candidatus Avimonas sp.]|jgi:thioredoxin 1|nr:thioredoxin [Clostridiales bacterium]HOB36567.1 thioredoxin [Candidatus Avimonas sp.]HQA16032.1 thioredoxin [Candidatus Avimonas sp.]HQD37994.1 thioredoxin [Candidatus Avimonas sp.]
MSTAIVYPNLEEFDQLISGDKPVLVDFWADWCMPCRMLAPVIEQLGEQYQGRAEVAKVNVDEYPELASRYRIQSIPTVMIFDKGELAEIIVGLNSADVYTKALDKLLGE